MQLPKLWVIGLAIVVAAVVGVAGLMLVQPPGALLQDAGFSLDRITPNADGETDVTIFSYRLSATADVTMAFENENGDRYVFRDNKRRVKGAYSVQFSGVVDGFRLGDEAGFFVPSETADESLPVLETRLLPDGIYQWTLTAVPVEGETETATGTLEIADGDTELPLIQVFEIGPTAFTPNQDGIADRVNVNVYLAKPAQLTVYLADEEGTPLVYLAERQGGREPGDAGNHEFDYDGGVDQGFRPPDDGDYTVYAVAQDDEGQRTVRVAQLRIEDSGLPQAEIIPQAGGGTVCFESAPYDEAYASDAASVGEIIEQPTTICSELTTLTLPVGDILIFHLTVSNYGETPIRTAGPFPGTVYDFEQRASTLGEYEESGAWRIAIDCETAESDYPWRWALAAPEQLTAVYDPEREETYYYLEPQTRGEVWGAIRMTQVVDARNPQNCWAGLIHEDVNIPNQQGNVGTRQIELVPRAE